MHVNPLTAHPTHEDAQNHASEHSPSFSLSYGKTLPATDKAPVPKLRRTRRLIITGPSENQTNISDLPDRKYPHVHTTRPPAEVENTCGEALHSRQQKLLYPPSSWKGDIGEGGESADNLPKSLLAGSKYIISTKTDQRFPNTNHAEPNIGRSARTKKLCEDSTNLSISSEDVYEYSALSNKPLFSRMTSVSDAKACNVSRDQINYFKSSASTKASPTTGKKGGSSVVTTQSTLPNPEIAYSQTFYYTTCPHASPPCSRPLNVQPTLVTYHQDLLRFAPFHLRIRPLDPAPEIYTLEGACSQCDLAARREAEIKVLEKYRSNVDDLSARLHELQGDIDLDSPTLPREYYGGMRQPSRSSNAMTDEINAVLTPEAIEKILSIETDLEALIKKREREIKFVWRGYTARWGPATLGVFRDQLYPLTRTTETAAANNADHSLSRLGNTSDELSIASKGMKSSTREVRSVSSGASSTTSFGSGSGASHLSFVRARPASSTFNYPTSSCDTPQSRYSNGMRQIRLPSPVDPTKQDGRMQIGWIRRDRKSTKKTSERRVEHA